MLHGSWKRTAQDATDKVETATRDADYWYGTGNLIIVSQGVAFRVQKYLLVAHSVVFRDMFAPSTPGPSTEDLFDGCLVATLDDSPKDWRELFGLLYPQRIGQKPLSDRKANMALISAIIRLGHKYGLEDLYDQAIGYLTACYTTSFDAWTGRRDSSQWQPDPIHAIRAINLARLTNTTSILPAAFYICATLGPDIARGLPLEDGSTEQLAPDDMHLVLGMQARLLAENARIAFLVFRVPSVLPCPWGPYSRAQCREVWRRLLGHAGLPEPEVQLPHPVASACALDSWVANMGCLPRFFPTPPPVEPRIYVGGQGWYHMSNLCEPCRHHLETRDWELRREVWRKLPGFLGLTIEGWDA
ncbi:hypothetical protein GSI_04516 [Ganoderma sinense ZZ0214-1]|uniref:BTB domain-containing protein n=1 Tax=Ganoderma sinense ZZ0214-1 TaxID=1077348 RepID=A0A2G8SH85_9APHY|nr:hypothetical protein GSI_04516 [Ganoderma sinense ZZ0214-1]